jgi:hypothetical protein
MFAGVKYAMIDWANHSVTIVLDDGSKVTEELGPESNTKPDQIARTVFDSEFWCQWNFTTRGDVVMSEAYNPMARDPLRGLPVVYLDQNHWRTVSLSQIDPSRVPKSSELEAAQELVRFATDDGVIVPLSSSHIFETSALSGTRRYEVGIVMAQLSRGWQMRHPATVQQAEATQVVARMLDRPIPEEAARPVFTLEPGAIFHNGSPPVGTPADAALLQQAIVSSMTVVEFLLDSQPMPKGDAEGWVMENQRLTDHLAEGELSQHLKQKVSYARAFYGELAPRVTTALIALSATDEEQRLVGTVDPAQFLKEGPMLSLYAHLSLLRHTDKSTVWERNDLIDMMSLTCAAGHATFVAGEKHTATQIRQAQKALGKPQNTYKTLHELVTAIHEQGVTTATERAAR